MEEGAKFAAGDRTLVGAPIAALITGAESASAIDESHGEKPAAVQPIFASPWARRLAREQGIDLESLPGSGPGGRIVRRDIECSNVVTSNI